MKTKGNFHPDIDNFDTIPFRKPEILHLILMFAGIPEECCYLDRENDLILIWSLLENVDCWYTTWKFISIPMEYHYVLKTETLTIILSTYDKITSYLSLNPVLVSVNIECVNLEICKYSQGTLLFQTCVHFACIAGKTKECLSIH